MRIALNGLLKAVIASALLMLAQARVTDNGEEARWLVHSSNWGTLSRIEGSDLKSFATSFADSEDGRIFFYLLGGADAASYKASLTISEAQVDPTQFDGARCGPDGDLDPEDPRCGKLSIVGTVSSCDEDSKQVALDALFASHPQMANWPVGHGFVPMEMKIKEEDGLWMIANYGGGGYMQASDYFDSTPVHHPMKSFSGGNRHLRSLEGSASSCYDMTAHTCECVAEKCGGDLCGAAGGIWSDQCPGTCDCEQTAAEPVSVPSSGDTPAEPVSVPISGDTPAEPVSVPISEDTPAEPVSVPVSGDTPADTTGNGDGDRSDSGQDVASKKGKGLRPDFGDDSAGHARWLVAKSLWTTISTQSSKEEGFPFGNIRSVADGACFLGSGGLPYFYVPAPDPTALDIKENNQITLSFTESVLSQRVGDDGIACGGKDAEDPTCAKIALFGRAIPIEDDDKIELARAAFKAQHPRAGWLASGGAHTGGSYYTMQLESITFIQTYGGFTDLSPEDYLNWKPDVSMYPGEEQCTSDGGQEHQHGTGDHSGGQEHQHGTGDHSGGHGNQQGMQDNGQQAQTQTTSLNQDSPISPSIITLLILASFFGSFFGGILPEKLNACMGRNNPNSRYNVTDANDHSLKLSVIDAEAC